MEIALVVIVLLFAAAVTLAKEGGLADSTNRKMIYVEQMAQEMQLSGGPVRAWLVRQSGNLYKDLGQFHTAQDALSEIGKSFRRAKIDSVYVQGNTDQKFRVVRLHHSHRGRAEGKGSAELA